MLPSLHPIENESSARVFDQYIVVLIDLSTQVVVPGREEHIKSLCFLGKEGCGREAARMPTFLLPRGIVGEGQGAPTDRMKALLESNNKDCRRAMHYCPYCMCDVLYLVLSLDGVLFPSTNNFPPMHHDRCSHDGVLTPVNPPVMMNMTAIVVHYFLSRYNVFTALSRPPPCLLPTSDTKLSPS